MANTFDVPLLVSPVFWLHFLGAQARRGVQVLELSQHSVKANVRIVMADGCRRAIKGHFDVLCVARVMWLSQDRFFQKQLHTKNQITLLQVRTTYNFWTVARAIYMTTVWLLEYKMYKMSTGRGYSVYSKQKHRRQPTYEMPARPALLSKCKKDHENRMEMKDCI